MSYYKYHVFICTNKRSGKELCCEQGGAAKIRAYAKAKIKQLGLSGEGKVRINTAGCLDRCDSGPVMVIYPEATWYTFVDEDDVDEIIQEHLLNGRKVERLLLP
ncbi:MAG: NAD(P)H-dependent oxidoreductase subunit E [Gammaproteobacteria bacterium]|nr:NAD(P)H-dependent oxidoreductase subunit E [Gammaproteobacteria bacterium]